VALWTLRILLRGGRRASPFPDGAALERATVAALGIPSARSLSSDALRRKLTTTLDRLEKLELDRSAPAFRNTETLASIFGLESTESDIIVLAALADEEEETLCDAAQLVGGRSMNADAIVGAALGLGPKIVGTALSPRGALTTTGLVMMPGSGLFRSRMEYRHSDFPVSLARGLAELLNGPRASAAVLTRFFFRRSPRPKLRLDDFAHIEDDVALLRSFVSGSLVRKKPGVHVLLYGPPGTGKTQLARALAADLGAPLYEVHDQEENGEVIAGSERLFAFSRAQRVLARARALLLFDEAEDVFRPYAMFRAREDGPAAIKAWTHRALEESVVPTIWTTNAVRQMDRATLRRFALAIELRPPPAPLRRRLFAKQLQERLPERAVERYALDERVTLAHIDNAAAVVKVIGARSQERTEAIVSRVIDMNIALSGPRRAAHVKAEPPRGRYDLAFLNVDIDLDGLVATLSRAPSATICLYGPPGTGKTAFVTHVAERLGRRLHVERASDLLGCFLGESEKNIAEMFRRARDEGTLLLLDEADSFLRDRARAERSWEVTQVNELLVQMEVHEGLFFCATNAVEALDAASLRRFALKVQFRPLRREQRWEMFCAVLGADTCSSEHRRALDELSVLTPGDFATASRQLALTHGSELDPAVLLRALRDECALKRGGTGRPIGFSEPASCDAAPGARARR
jgi:SpoVK/Ycf46/Vps4 family AAA+-type ATPase